MVAIANHNVSTFIIGNFALALAKAGKLWMGNRFFLYWSDQRKQVGVQGSEPAGQEYKK